MSEIVIKDQKCPKRSGLRQQARWKPPEKAHLVSDSIATTTAIKHKRERIILHWHAWHAQEVKIYMKITHITSKDWNGVFNYEVSKILNWWRNFTTVMHPCSLFSKECQATSSTRCAAQPTSGRFDDSGTSVTWLIRLHPWQGDKTHSHPIQLSSILYIYTSPIVVPSMA